MSRPFPNIPRLPGEPKLEGVPHLKKESIFSEPGIVDALEIVDATIDLNSAQRRPVIDQAVKSLLKTPDQALVVLSGLDRLQNEDVLASPGRRLQASFISETITPKIACVSQEDENPPVEVQAVYRPSWEIDWAATNVPKENKNNLRRDKILRLEVAKRVSVGEVYSKDNVELGIKLANKYYDPDLSIPQLLDLYLDIAHEIDRAKVKASSRNHTTEVSNAIIMGVAGTFAQRMPCDDETLRIVNEVAEAFKANPKLGWSSVKVTTLGNILTNRNQLQFYMGQMKSLNTLMEKMDDADAKELDAAAAEAMVKLRTLRKYGIKPAYFRDGIMHCAEDSWVIKESADFYAMEDGFRVHAPEIAVILLAHAQEISDLEGQKKTVGYGRGKLTHIEHEWGAHFVLGLMPDGELIVSGTQGATPIKQDFEDSGLGALYQHLRISHINRLIDLTVPVEMLREMPSLSDGQSIPKKFGNLIKTLKPQKLLLPRLHYVNDNFDAIKESLDRELAEAEERSLREHEVVGHRRILPPGYKASPEARLEAARAGILLADNETWVTKHKRGTSDNGQIKSHLAVRPNGIN